MQDLKEKIHDKSDNMSKIIEQLIEIDHFLKNYMLYCEFLNFKLKNEKALVETLEALKDMGMETKAEERQYSRLQSAMSKIDENHEKIEQDFKRFDFSPEIVKEKYTDYKIVTFQFVKESFDFYLQDDNFKDRVPDEDTIGEISNIILDFFKENFFFIDEMASIFAKVQQENILKLVQPN